MPPTTSWQSQLCLQLRTAFPGPEEVIHEFPTFGGSAAFGACVASPSLGLHVFCTTIVAERAEELNAHAIRTAAFLSRQLPATFFCWTLGPEMNRIPNACPIEWPSGPAELRRQLLGRARPSIERLGSRERLTAWSKARSLMHAPLGSFDAFDRNATTVEIPSDDRPLVTELLSLRKWLARQTLDARQQAASRCNLLSPLTLIRGTAGCGKTTVISQLAAHWLCDESDARCGRVLLLGSTRGAAKLLAKRVRGVHRRLTGIARLPAGTRALPVKDVGERMADMDAQESKIEIGAVFIDEAQELTEAELRALVAILRPGQPGGPKLVMAYDPLQRIRDDAAPSLDALVEQWAIPAARLSLRHCYRTPRQVFECALRARFHGMSARNSVIDAEAQAWLEECRRDRTIRIDVHGGFHTESCARGIGIGGRPSGAPPRLVTASPEGTLLAEVASCAEAFRESGAEWNDIVVAAPDSATRERLRAEATSARVRASWRPSLRGERTASGIAVRTVEELRGEDWPIVIIPIPDDIVPDETTRARLYVAATRAQHSLTFVAMEGTPGWKLANEICH